MSQEEQWHLIDGNGTQCGPYTGEQLQEFANNGTIVPTTQLWAEGLEGWILASDVESLFSAQTKGSQFVSGRETRDIAPSGPHWLETRLGAKTLFASLAVLCMVGALVVYGKNLTHIFVVIGILLGVLLVAALVVLAARSAIERSRGRDAATLTIVSDSDKIGLGQLLEGEVEVVAKQPLEDCYFEVSLTLFALVRVIAGDGGGASREEDRWVALADPTQVLIPKRTFHLAAGESRTFAFSMLAPTHQPNTRPPGGFASMGFGADLKETMKMSASELLSKKELKWQLKVEAMGIAGKLIAEKELGVDAQVKNR